ncbi:MAG: TolC family protein [Candidatus Margulisbacteria bacterium]|nr:TolC family protein [Candidatus Margulisiibacteriota bacterium]
MALILISAAAAEPLTLSAAVARAAKNNPELAAARAQWEAAKAKVPQAISFADPKLGLEYDQIPSGSRKLEDGMKMYTAEQMIMFPGKIYAEWQMAGREADLFNARYKAKLLEIASQTRAAYYELYMVDRSIKVVAEVKDLLAGAKKTSETKYTTGMVAQTDLLQANIEYLMMNNELITLEQERKVKEAKLKSFIASPDSDAVTIETETELDLPGLPASPDELEKSALKNRPELLAMKAELDARDAGQLRSKLEFFPDLDLGVRKRVNDGWDAMISFSVPLYFWKQGFGLSAAGLEREAAEAAYRNMQNMTRWEVREAYVMAETGIRTLELYKKSILPQSRQAVKVGLTAYQAGKIDFQALLLAEKMYREAGLKYYETQAGYGKARAELERIIGGEIK